MIKQTVLYDKHVLLNAKMAPFAGYMMPMSYSGIINEHNAVRNMLGIFDVSHMGEIKIERLGGAALAIETVDSPIPNWSASAS